MEGKRNSVLIIDDERDNISSLKTILSPEYIIYASTSGKDAIETANEFLPDIILLDVLMPDIDGYEVITAFKNSEKTRDIPVIFLTGVDDINAEIKGLELGAADYILKPFHPAIVKLRIKNHIMLIEKLRQEALIINISHNFLSYSDTEKLYADSLRLVGEFMDISTILLFRSEKTNNELVCRCEWINSKLKIETRIGDILYIDENIIFAINNLLANDERKLCISSKDLLSKDFIKLNRKYLDNYIAAPIFIKGNMNAFLVFSRDGDSVWKKSEIDLAVLIAGIFSGVFERESIQHSEYISSAKSEFLARMSHEMRTPMNSIIGILQILELMGVPEEMAEHCEVMEKSAITLQHLIDDVLDISDMEYKVFNLSESVFDFKTMLRDVLLNADKKASGKKQMLNCKTDPAIPIMLCGDEKRLKQVISHLLVNAVKFTPENGEIFCNTRIINDDKDTITLRFEIIDNGIGIAEEDHDRIFQIFEQADSSSGREYNGIGIGLALLKRIAEMMGGNIWLESKLGKGSKFYFSCKLKKVI